MKLKPETVLKEINALLYLKNSPNFLSLKEILPGQPTQSDFAWVFDYFNHTPTHQILPLLTKKHLKHRTYQSLKTLDYIHSVGVIHRGIKLENILMNPETLEFKLIDVGQGEYFLPGKEKITIVGSSLYKAPELILNITTYDTQWIFGQLV